MAGSGGIEAPVTDDEEDDKARRSRRARRREQREQSAGEGGGAEPSTDQEEQPAEAAEDAGETAEEGPSDGTEQAASAPRPGLKKKKKKRRPEGGGAGRDRNRSVRDRAEARRQARQRRSASVHKRKLDPGEMVDDALSRQAQAVVNWLKEHFNVVQWLVLALIAGGIGYWVYSWHTEKLMTKASDDLAVALADGDGRIMSESAPETSDEEHFDIRPQYPNDKARLAATAAAYRKAMKFHKGSGASILAELGLAGTLYDQGKYGEALNAYRAVQHSALAKHDPDVKGRALEGAGMCLEAKGDNAGAAKAYRELASTDQLGFVSLGLYHQARIAYAQGKTTAALDLLKKAEKKLNDPRSPYDSTGYLAQMTHSLMQTVNPGYGSEFSPAQLGQLRQQIMKDPTKLKALLKRMGKSVPAPNLPPPELPTGLPPSSPPARAPSGAASARARSSSAPTKSAPRPSPHPTSSAP